MNNYSRDGLSPRSLDRNVDNHLASKLSNTAELLADLAAIDSSRAFLVLGYPSMYCYCLAKLRFEDSASRYLYAARKVQRFPQILPALAGGRLHLSGLVMLAPHLSEETPQEMCEELLRAAEKKSKSEIALLLAHRFPQPDIAAFVRPIPQPAIQATLQAPAEITLPAAEATSQIPTAAPAVEHVPAHTALAGPPARVRPLSPGRFGVQFTIAVEDHELLERAKALLAHQIPSGKVEEIFVRALRVLVTQLEGRKFGTGGQPRETSRETQRPRYVPAHVRSVVRKRDGDRCTFVSEQGHRCEERRFLEFDHVLEVARGGQNTIDNVRLRCRAHNQFTAEQTYGRAFMRAKRHKSTESTTAHARSITAT